MAFKEELRRQRKAKGLRQDELSHAIGVVPSTVYKWERGAVFPSRQYISSLAKFFGIKEKDLMFPDDENEDSKNVH